MTKSAREKLQNKKSSLKRTAGLSLEEADRMMEEQGGKCALGSAGCSGLLGLDKSRETIRGILCRKHSILLAYYLELRAEVGEEIVEKYLAGKLTKFRENKSELGTCNVGDCSNAAVAKGLCHKHYRAQLHIDHEKVDEALNFITGD